jgi:hypothetical protein
MTDRPIVFLGPTLPHDIALRILAAEYLPPVQLGDVWRISQERPPAIGIIDGYFDRVPAVRHKEILYALSLGIRVYGCSSIGALRAAELSAFGMVAVGDIATAYLSGDLRCDDEVALLHSDGAHGYRAFSEPLVNIRATTMAAFAAGIVSRGTAHALVETARNLYYPDRVWEHILETAPADAPEIEAFRMWLPLGRVDRKRVDAITMLQRMRGDLALSEQDRPAMATPPFTPTVLWQEFVRQETPIAAILEEFLLTDPLTPAVRGAVAQAQRGEPVDWFAVLASEPGWRLSCRRARLKRQCRAAVTDRTGNVDGLLAWFFGERLGWPTDIEAFLRDRGWTDPAAVLAVAAREAAFHGGVLDQRGDPPR